MVGVIVVNYNSGEEILRLIDSLERQTFKEISLVIVDNKSPDGSGITLKGQIENGVVILNSSNDGFAAGVNTGIEYFRKYEKSVRYLWILNPDMVLSPNALQELFQRGIERDSIVGSKILFPPSKDGQSRIWAAGGFIDFINQETLMRGSGEIDEGQYEETTQADYVPGCSLFTSLDVIQRVGQFPEEYFLYFEETDWCQRAVSMGIPIIYEPKSVVTHCFREEKLKEPLAVYYYNRNKRLFFFRYSAVKVRISVCLKTIFKDLPRSIRSLKEAPDDDYRALFQSHVDSCKDFIFNRFGRRDRLI